MRTQFYYKNHRGEVELRTVEVISLDYVAVPNLTYGYGPGWFLHCRDYTLRDGKPRTGEARSFALDHIWMREFKQGTLGVAPAFRLILAETAPLGGNHWHPGDDA